MPPMMGGPGGQGLGAASVLDSGCGPLLRLETWRDRPVGWGAMEWGMVGPAWAPCVLAHPPAPCCMGPRAAEEMSWWWEAEPHELGKLPPEPNWGEGSAGAI